MRAVAHRLGAYRSGVGTHMGLGKTESSQMIARAKASENASRWLSLPNLRIGPQTTELLTLTMVEQAPSPDAISSKG